MAQQEENKDNGDGKIKCVFHNDSVEENIEYLVSKGNIRSCLEYLLEKNDVGEAQIAQRLETEYKYSSIVYNSSGLVDIDCGGLNYIVSKWDIKDGDKDINSQYTIFMIYGQKLGMISKKE